MIFGFFLSSCLVVRVTIGSWQHVLPIILVASTAILLIRASNRKLNQQKKIKTFQFLGALVSLTVIVFHIYHILLGNYNLSEDLPLFLCSFLALIMPCFTYTRRYWMYEILLFWIIAGTLQGVITPDISNGFPSLDYFRYWIVHLGLLTIIFYATFVLKMRPKFKSVFKSFFALQIYVIILMVLNNVLGANYSYLNSKPESASALDYFGEWPYYLLVMEVILIPFFLLIYWPFYVTRKK